MSLLGNYVSRTVLGAMLLVLVLLLGLDLVFAFLGELEDLKAGYQTSQALWYVLLSLPFTVYDMIPVAALIGGIVGLGLLAGSAELTVMRAAGISIWRMVWWVMRPAMVLVVASLALAEYVVPATHQMAEAGKARALGEHYQDEQLYGYWQRQGDGLVQIRHATTDGVLHEVCFYQFDSQGRLHESRLANSARYQGQHAWRLMDVRVSQLASDGSARVGRLAEQVWRTDLTPDFLQLVTVSPEYLPPSRLYRYADYLRGQELSAAAYFLEFWKKALSPLATLSMVLVACSFIFGPLRSVTMGLRIISGILAGLGFRYLQDFAGYASLIYHFSPLLAALLPIALSLLGGIVALRRVG